MSANVYSIENLLVGTRYNSRTLSGVIVRAEEHPHGVWYEGCDSYLVEVQPDNSIRTTYRTIAVKNN